MPSFQGQLQNWGQKISYESKTVFNFIFNNKKQLTFPLYYIILRKDKRFLTLFKEIKLNNFIQKFLITVVLATSLFSPAFAVVDYQIEHQPQVIEKVVQFEQKGILKQKDNGYLYVEVSRDFIAEALPLIDAQGKIVPPRHYSSKKGIGAHISVMYENEQIDNEIWEIHELGQEYTFSVMELRTVKLNKDGKMKKLWLLAVAAPELEKLRESYGLSSKLKGHDFHITIGTQVPGKPQAQIEAFIIDEVEEFAETAEAA